MKELLTREECTAMKGMAILGIMLHNYCHWLKGIVRENEYTWVERKTDYLWQVLQQPDSLLPIHLFSFFGHYGVPVFLFLSGFGLVMKYERTGDSGQVSLWRFARYNYLKLFRILIVGFVLFTMFDVITPGMHRYQPDEVLAMLGMYANFYPHPSQVIWPGPYWYFGVTLQLYLLYRLVMYRRHWGIVVALIVVCWLCQEWGLGDDELQERLRYNFIGGMLPFGMGVLAARLYPEQTQSLLGVKSGFTPGKVWAWSALAFFSCLAVFAMSFSEQAWLWIPVFIVVGTIAFVKLLPAVVLRRVVWLGSISAVIFVMHPLLRKCFIRPYMQYDVYSGLLLYVAATLLVSWLVKQLITRIPSPRL